MLQTTFVLSCDSDKQALVGTYI